MRMLIWSLVVASFHGIYTGSTISLLTYPRKPDLTQLFSVLGEVCACYCKGFLIYSLSDLDEDASSLNYVIASQLHRHCTCSVLVLRAETWMETNDTEPHISRIADIGLVVASNLDSLNAILNNLQRNTHWHPRCLTSLVLASINFIDSVHHILLSHGISNCLVMVPENESVSVSIFKSYGEADMCDTAQEHPKELELNVDICDELSMPSGLRNNIYKHFSNCPLRMSTFPWSPFVEKFSNASLNQPAERFSNKGIEMELFLLVAQKLKMKPMSLPFGQKIMWTWSWDKIVEDVFSRKADVGFCSLTMLPQRIVLVDFTLSYFINAVSWVVPRPGPIHVSKNVVRVFSTDLWVANCAAFLAISGFVCIAFRCERVRKVFLLYRALVLQPVIPADKTWFMILLLDWVMFCSTICMAYQSSLTSFLTEPAFEPPIEDDHQLFHSDLALLYSAAEKGYLQRLFGGRTEAYSWREDVCRAVEACLQRVALDRDAALLSDKMFVLHYVSRHLTDDQGRALVRSLADDALRYPVVALVPRGSPLLPVINDVISRANEAGLPGRWQAELLRWAYLKGQSYKRSDKGSRPVSIEHLRVAWISLTFGIILASTALVVELFSVLARNQEVRSFNKLQ